MTYRNCFGIKFVIISSQVVIWDLFRGPVVSRGGCSRSSRRASRNQKDGGWLLEPIWQAACRHVASVDVVQAATKVGQDWCDVVHELERDVRDVDQPPERSHSQESQ